MDITNSSSDPSNIWKTFERTSKEGHIKQFWIQSLPDSHIEIAVNYFTECFVKEEPICRAMNVMETEGGLEAMKNIWRNAISEKCCLACFTKDDKNEHKLVALNLCYKSSSSSQKTESHSYQTINDYISNFKNLYQMFNVDGYLGSVGLITLPEYRGYNIGKELLESRKYLCQELGLKLAVTLFTGPASQRLAEKAGYKDVYPVSIDEIEKENPHLIIPNLRNFTKKLRLMYILYDF
ncbi:hypothetical protein WA026_003399 [Henosepilachna vigintioctopunctata]|uniref:N-acetyltransferase domain-containing protein n=1 Tax=Henosepilachna vigintioctopunctata TaxID=420089 RepID=A0AAW1THF8_9CUCU